MMTKADLENELKNAHLEIGKLRAEVSFLQWHRQTNDRFLDILGSCSKEGTLRIDRTTRQHQEDIKR